MRASVGHVGTCGGKGRARVGGKIEARVGEGHVWRAGNGEARVGEGQGTWGQGRSMCMAKARHMWGKRSGHVWRAGKGEARIGRVQGTCGGRGRTRLEAREDGLSTCGGNCETYKGVRVEHV